MFCENKSICFFGDSNTNEGKYISYLREFFSKNQIRVHLFNNGIGGTRIDMLKNIVEEELDMYTPDFAVLSYGTNDLGIWLYGKDRVLDEEDKLEIERRINLYAESLENMVKLLKSKNIMPIVFSPFCVNENITEREGIVKREEGFYKIAENYNGKIEELREKILALKF